MRGQVYVIAEAGVNHNGSLELAKQLVDVAARAGASAIKFQSFDADKLAIKTAPKAAYQALNSDPHETQSSMLRRLQLSARDVAELKAYCDRVQIEFLASGFDELSVDMLIRIGVGKLKVPSGEITNLPLLRHVGSRGLPLILSTGMSDLEEVKAALTVLTAAGAPKASITLLHCTSSYPTAMPDVNLRAMVSMRAELGTAVGYSDHTLGIEVAIAAVGLGATVIEKHITLSRDLPGPDHSASLEPQELVDLVAAIRNVEDALGDGVKRVASGEVENRLLVRKSLYASHQISAGDLLSPLNVAVKRPGTGLSPMLWDSLMGTPADRDYQPDEAL
jgi:N,N'-diacetyllegionaminate synthase